MRRERRGIKKKKFGRVYYEKIYGVSSSSRKSISLEAKQWRFHGYKTKVVKNQAKRYNLYVRRK